MSFQQFLSTIKNHTGKHQIKETLAKKAKTKTKTKKKKHLWNQESELTKAMRLKGAKKRKVHEATTSEVNDRCSTLWIRAR